MNTPEQKPGFFERLQSIDKRYIYLMIALGVLIPLIKPIGLPIRPSGPAKKLYSAIDSLKEGDVILMSFDYGASTKPELYPMSLALLKHFFRKNLKVVVVALWPEGAQMAVNALHTVATEMGKKYGKDYVNLGFKTGGLILIRQIGSGIKEAFPTDINNTPLEKLPMMQNIHDYSDIDMVIELSAGAPGIPEWIMVAKDEFNTPVGGGCTAVSAPDFYPYLQSGQLVGLLGGLKGAAEYESLVGYKGKATAGMDSQSIAHLIIILFIILGNLSYFITRLKR